MNLDFLVIGAGVAGCATALELAEAGARVAVVERGEIGRESSWAGGGILFPLLPWDYGEAVNALVERSVALYPAWTAELKDATGIDPEYWPCGMLVLPPFDAGTARAWCESRAMRLETVRPGERVPGLAVDGDALWLPGVPQARTPRLLKALGRRLEQLGVEVREHAGVAGWRIGGRRVLALETAAGPLQAERYIVAAGAWSGQLLDALGPRPSIRPVRGQMLLFRGPPGLLPAIVLQGGTYLIPRRDGRILAGSTLEEAGFDASPTEEAKAMLLQRATAILPPLADLPLERHWAGLRPGSPGNVPIIGRHPRWENLYLNAGHFRYGVTMAPASAECLVDQLLGRPRHLDPVPYAWPAAPSRD